jgi:3-hydroxyacyl-[acyl-carrier-protein] dehydratase
MANENNTGISFGIPEIKAFQKNRYPLLFLDKIENAIPGQFARGIKCFSYNEWFFPAHFEDDPSVPGFVQVEALVQTFLMTFLTIDGFKGEKAMGLSWDKVKFKRTIVPGECLVIESYLTSFKRGIAKGYSTSSVNGEDACSAEFMVVIPSVMQKFNPKEK